jgi:hypothetical protein
MCECCDFVAARGGRPGDPELTAQFSRLWRFRTRADVAINGFVVQAVESEWPPFAYTIGLWGLGHPELVIFGLDPTKATGLLHLIGEDVRDNGLGVEAGADLQPGDWAFKAFRLPTPGDVVLRANDFYRRTPTRSVPALQLVYPDRHGVWPWEPDCQLLPGQQPMPGTFVA